MSDTMNVGWLLDNFQERVSGVSHAIAVSADGMLIARTQDLPADHGEKLAAIASGLVSLLGGADRMLNGGGVLVNMTELGNGYLISMSISTVGSLLVLAAKTCDIGTVSYEMHELIDKVGSALAPGARGFAAATAGWSQL